MEATVITAAKERKCSLWGLLGFARLIISLVCGSPSLLNEAGEYSVFGDSPSTLFCLELEISHNGILCSIFGMVVAKEGAFDYRRLGVRSYYCVKRIEMNCLCGGVAVIT